MLAALFSTAHAQDALPATTEVTYLATCIKDTVAGKVLSDTSDFALMMTKPCFTA